MFIEFPPFCYALNFTLDKSAKFNYSKSNERRAKMNILFWNTNRKNPENVTACLCELLLENAVDLLILAEYPNITQDLCNTINASELDIPQYIPIPAKKLKSKVKGIIINKLYSIKSVKEDNRYQLAKITTPTYNLLVAMIHGKDIRNNPRLADRQHLIRQFKNDIIEHEQQQNCQHTIAIGDFNISPFEEPMFATEGMHALPFADSFAKSTTKIGDAEYKKFYNPTWKLFANKNPPFTTYYYKSDGGTSALYWYAIDQVIISPSLMDAFGNSLKIISKTANHSLLKKGKPNEKIYSDHLPLFCQLEEEFM